MPPRLLDSVRTRREAKGYGGEEHLAYGLERCALLPNDHSRLVRLDEQPGCCKCITRVRRWLEQRRQLLRKHLGKILHRLLAGDGLLRVVES